VQPLQQCCVYQKCLSAWPGSVGRWDSDWFSCCAVASDRYLRVSPRSIHWLSHTHSSPFLIVAQQWLVCWWLFLPTLWITCLVIFVNALNNLRENHGFVSHRLVRFQVSFDTVRIFSVQHRKLSAGVCVDICVFSNL